MRRTRPAAVAASLAMGLALAAPVSATPTWLGSVALSAQGRDAVDPLVATDPDGNVTAVWARGDGANYRIQASSRSRGTEWSTPDTLSVAGQDATQPQVVVDAAGTATVVWERTNGVTDQIRTSSRPLGGSWSTPVTLASAAQDDVGDPRLALDAVGNVTVAYNILASGSRRIEARTRPPGGAWTPAVQLSAAGQSARDHAIAGHPAGAGFTAIWMRPDGSDGRIQVSSRSPEGVWSSATTISAAGREASSPDVAVHRDGDVTAVWTREDGAHRRIQARTRRGTVNWLLAPVSDLSEPGQHADQARVAVAPDGTTTVVWSRFDGVAARVQASTRPEGGTWSVVPDTLSQAGQIAREAQVAYDAAGNATATWSRSDGADYRIQASRKPASGAWEAPTTLSAAGQSAELPRLAVDGAGDVVALWSRSDGIADRVETTTLDVAGPIVTALDVPSTATAGQPVPLAVSAYDAWSAVASVGWSFGDGTTATGSSTAPTFASAGTRTVTVTVTDAVGNSTTRQTTIAVAPAPVVAPPPPAAQPAPRITSFTLTRRTIEITGPRRRTRTRAVLVLTAEARVRIVVRKKGVTKPVATLIKALDAGRNTFRLSAKVGNKRLRPGTYRLRARATNAAGTSRAVAVRLRVVR